MASTQSKLSGSGKASVRPVSASRLVAQKASKPHKLAAADKPRSGSSHPPAALAKTGRWPKSRTPTLAAASVKSDERSPSHPTDTTTRSGLSKAELKQQFAKLSAATSQIGGLKRALNKTFYDIGVLLTQVRNERLFEVKGYGSFEAFVEREIDINKAICMKIVRIAEAIQRDQALAAGLERSAAAIAALDGETEPTAGFRPVGSPAGGIPVHKQ